MPQKSAGPGPLSYSTAEVAKSLGVSVPTVQRWVDAGHLVAWKTLGGHRRIDAASADRLFASRGQLSKDAPPPLAADRPVVVLVDDNPDDRDLMTAVVLTALPHAELHAFDNGMDALVAIGQHAPDIVITDIVMPHMNGAEMLRRLTLLVLQPAPLLIAVSSNHDALGQPKVLLPTGVHFVPKPLNPDVLLLLLGGWSRLAGSAAP